MDQPNASPRAAFLGADDGGAGRNVSWGAVLAGTVTFLAVLVTFSLLGAAIGFGVPDLASDQPFEGLGVGLSIWALVTLVLALGAGGFVTGILAVRAGFVHGAVTWATSLLAVVILLAVTTSAALGAVGSLVGGAASVVGEATGGVASIAGDAVDGATDLATDALGDIDTEQLGTDIEEVLADTDVPELQPDYLQGEIDATGDDIAAAGEELVSSPDRYDEILDDLITQVQERVDTIADAADRDAVAEAVASNSDLSEEEAAEATDRIVDGLETAVEEAQSQLDEVEVAIEEVRVTVESTVEEARQVAEDATDAAARAAAWAFVGVLVGLAVTAFAALWGASLVTGRDEGGHVRARARS